MVLGVDVYRDKGSKAGVAAVVASLNSHYSKYFSKVSIGFILQKGVFSTFFVFFTGRLREQPRAIRERPRFCRRGGSEEVQRRQPGRD